MVKRGLPTMTTQAKRTPILVTFVIAMCSFYPIFVNGQTTDIVILNKAEANTLRHLVGTYPNVRSMYDSIQALAEEALAHKPKPQAKLSYEGMLPTHPDRIATEKALEEMDMVVNLIYASYGADNEVYGEKARQFVLDWSSRYIPTGNPINENKLSALLWAYYLFKDRFSTGQKQQVEQWMQAIAQKELSRPKTPNNNWEAKRLKLIAIIGSVLQVDSLNTFAIDGFKDYIATAYYADGTSNDLRDRDALRYHVSGLTPTVAVFVNGVAFDRRYNLYDFVAPSGSSVSRSVDYVMPYAVGEKQRKEWTNSKAAIDKRRAEAGLAEYQPGVLYDRHQAFPLFAWSAFFKEDAFRVFGESIDAYTASWVGLLNSPLIRSR